MEINDTAFVIVKGFIDAKNEKDRSLWGSFVALASRRDVSFVSVKMSSKEISKNVQWKDLLALHRSSSAQVTADYVNIENMLGDFFMRNAVLNTLVKNHNTKAAEQSVSRFCMEEMGLRAVTFMDFVDATDGDMAYINTLKKQDAPPPPKEEPQPQKPAPAAAETKAQTQSGQPGQEEIFVRCEPLLDPIGGIAMNELQTGDTVCAKLFPDSVFYKLLARTTKNFDGVITAEVTGILVNELGTATISMKLADNVSGIMKLSGKVKVKTTATGMQNVATRAKSRPFRLVNLSPETIVAFSSILLVITAILALFYIMDF